MARPLTNHQAQIEVSLRASCLQWINQTLETIGLRAKTKEMTLILSDTLLEKCYIGDKDLECFSVSCILLVLKLETDLNPRAVQFLDYVTQEMRLTSKDMRQMEFSLLQALPSDFSLMAPLREIIHALCKFAGSSIQDLSSVIQTSYQTYIQTLLTRRLTGDEFDHLLGQIIDSIAKHLKNPASLKVLADSLRENHNCSQETICALREPLFKRYKLRQTSAHKY